VSIEIEINTLVEGLELIRNEFRRYIFKSKTQDFGIKSTFILRYEESFFNMIRKTSIIYKQLFKNKTFFKV
jgi:hypothetical protein